MVGFRGGSGGKKGEDTCRGSLVRGCRGGRCQCVPCCED